MNKHTHRLVFDRRRGMRVPAAEHARSAGKAAGGQTRAAVAVGVLSLIAMSDCALAQLRTDSGAAAGAVSRLPSVNWGGARMAADVAAALNRARPNLPTYTADGNWKLNTGDYKDPTYSADGRIMTLVQNGKTIVLNWDTFDISKGYELRFVQKAGDRALNRVYDVNPSVIDGGLSGRGEIVIENRNGVVFGPNARVQAGSLVATALQVTNEAFEKNFRNFRDRTAAFGGVEDDKNGFIGIEPGAEIKALAGGDVIMVAPRIVNKGRIETPQGQAILAAGKTVYLFAQSDLAQRGLMVAVDNFAADGAQPDLGTVVHEGVVQADKGTINLVGAAIRQKGRLTATTAVKGQNGAIYLQAMESTADGQAPNNSGEVGSANAQGKVKVAQKLGVIELAEGSVTEVLPTSEGLALNAQGQLVVQEQPKEPAALKADASPAEKAAYEQAKARYDADLAAYKAVTQQASDTFYRSRIDIIGADITLRSGAKVIAPAGEINILAAEDWQGSVLLRDDLKLVKDNSLIRMESGATVDASGLDNLRLPGSRHQLKGRLFSIELADSPLQRGGVLYRSELLADARRDVTVGDVSGLYANWRYTAAELSTVGGIVRMQAQGFLDLMPGAKVDFSGGSVVYESTSVTSSLLADATRPNSYVRIENADAGTFYSAFLSDPSRATASELARFGLSADAAVGSNVPEILVGQNAGAAIVGAPSMRIDATLDGSVVMSDQQRQSKTTSGLRTGYDQGVFVMGNGLSEWTDASHAIAWDPALTQAPNLYTTLRPNAGSLVIGNEVGGVDNDLPNGELVNQVRITASGASGMNEAGEFVISAAALQQAGLGALNIMARSVSLGDASEGGPAASLRLVPGARIDVRALDNVRLNGSLVAQGGDMNIAALSGGIEVKKGSLLSIAGVERDERFSAAPANEAVDVTAGTLKLSAGQGIELQGGLDVSAGAWRAKAGGFRAGDAGTVELAVNAYRPSASAQVAHTLTLGEGFGLSGFDFDNGAVIKVTGLPAIAIGDRFEQAIADDAFRLDVQALANRGFGAQSFSAIGDVTVGQGAVVAPVLRNLVQDPTRYSQASLARVDTLPSGKRSGVQLSLTATAEPAVEGGGPVGLEQGADVLIERGARVDVGAGGRINLKAGGNIDVSGALVARGGQVNLSLSGKRGADPSISSDQEGFGHLEGQHIALHDGALLDVSGVVKSYRPDGQREDQFSDEQVRVFGEVLGGGSVTIGSADGSSTRGRFIASQGSLIKLDGAQGELDFGRTVDKRRVAAGAGNLTIGVTDGFEMLGGLSAQAADASVAGGTVKIVLTQDRLIDRTGVSAYPSGEQAGLRTIHLSATNAEATELAGDRLKFGEGVVAAGALLGAGFERISLRADHSVAFEAGANLVSTSTRGPLQSVVLDAPLISLNDGGVHLVRANHVGLGQFSPAVPNRAPLADATRGSVVGAQGGLSGEGVLGVSAGLIEVSGDVGIQGAKTTVLDATLDRRGGNTRTNGEVRFVGAREVNSKELKGQLSYAGALLVRAGQAYATTLSDFDVVGFSGPTGTSVFSLLAPERGSSSQAPLSALASLSLKSDTVYIDGLIRQPFGAIDITAQNLGTGPNARLSVSGLNNDGSELVVPVGTTVNQSQWVYATQGAVAATGLTETLDADTNKTLIDLSKRTVDKHVSLNGQTLSMTDSTLVDGRAGGDLVAWEFKAGVGGSTDTYNRAGVYAILPGYSFDFAPHDADITASSSKLGKGLKAGDQVTVSTGSSVLAAGTYTLLDARYGILPGAVLVQATSVNTSQGLTQAIANDDGSVIVSGFMGSTGTARNAGSPKLALKLEPQATHRAQSEVILTSGNAYIDQLAERTGDSLRRAGDGARVSFVAQQAFDFAAQVRLAGRQGLRAGVLDLAMPDMTVSQAPVSAGDGSGTTLPWVSLDVLEATGAESILLGGQRTLTTDGWQVSRLANSVRLAGNGESGGTLQTSGELLAVARGSVRVDDGVSVVSTGADSGDSRHYLIQGDGAALLVGNLVDTDVAVQGVSDAPAGDLVLGQAKLSGKAVQLDATGALRVNPKATVTAASLGLGAQRVAVGASMGDVLAEGTLDLSGQLLQEVNGAQRLQLRAYQGIDLYRNVTLGSTSLDKLTLDTPLLRGVGTADQVARVQARDIVLSNRTGSTAGAESGGSQVRIEATPVRRDGRTGGLTVGASASSDASQAASGQKLAFVKAVLASQGDVVFDQRGKLVSQSDLSIEAARVTAKSNAEQTVEAGGTLVVKDAVGSSTLGESLGAGGALTLSGQRVEQRGVVDIESGKLTLRGTGQSGRSDTVVFAQGSTTSVKGRVKQVSENLTVASHGGTIRAQADAGQIRVNGVLDASAPVMPTGISGSATDAGTISLKSTGAGGTVVMGDTGQLRLEAISGGQGGTLQVDARRVISAAQAQAEADGAKQSASQIDALVKAASSGSATQAHHRVDVRVRDGDVVLDTQLHSHNVHLTADGGKLELGASANVVADAEQGGLVQLQSQGDLTLQHGAQISARSTRQGGNGGDVLLSSTDGRVKLGDATVVADSASDDLDGRIVIRAGRNGSDIAVDRLPDDGQAATQLKLQAGQVELVGVKVYESKNRTRLIAGDQTDNTWGLKTLQGEADDYVSQANRTAMLGRLGLAGGNVSVKAEAEIRSAGNFTISNDNPNDNLNFEPDSGKLPMNLTVRAGGDLSVAVNVSAGFGSAVKVAPAAAAPVAISAGDASSFRFVAGADTGSANLMAVKEDSTKGHFELAGDKHIRTTAGSIEVAAAGDVRLLSTSVANTTSAIYVAGRLANLAAGEVSAGNFKWAQHTERGGRLSVSAGRDLLSLFPSKDKDTGEVTLKPQVLTQLTTNYFFHAGANASEVSWWTAFDSFRQGLGSFGGGNLLVKAGHDIGDMPVVSLTNAQSVKLSSGTTELRVRGGGDVEIDAGGDISGGLFVLGSGDGHVTAGGAITTGASYASKSSGYTSTTDILSMGTLFGLMDGTWSVKAHGDIAVSHVFNPTILPMPVTKGSEGAIDAAESASSKLATNTLGKRSLAGYFFTYGEDAGIVMTSTAGNINWQADNDSLENIQLLNRSRYAAETITDTTVHGYLSQAANLAPSVIVANSLNGSVSIDAAGTKLSDSERANWKPLLVMPADASDVRMYAAYDISLSGNIQVLDWSQSAFLTASSSQPLGAKSYGAQSPDRANLMGSLNASSLWGRQLGTGYSALVDGNDVTLTGSAGSSDRGALNDNIISLVAGRDVVFSAVRSSDTNQLRASLRVNRPSEISAGRDLITPTFLGQNFAEDDVTRMSAGRDIIGGNVDTGAILISGPGQLRVEAGRDVLLQQSSGIAAIGNIVNQALPDQGAKITVAAGMAREVNLPEATARHGADAAFRAELRAAVIASQLPPPTGLASWAEASDAEVEGAFSTLTNEHQVAALQRYLDARFVALYLPDLAGRDASYFRSDDFQRRKQETMWRVAQELTSQAAGIAGSDNAAEEVRRQARRQALYEQAAEVVELAGLGHSFDRSGLVNLADARVHNLAPGGGSAFSLIDNSQGGIDVIAADSVLAGLPSKDGQAHGFVNFAGGSFRSLSGGDFLAGDQKVIVAGRGNLYIYSTDGDIDSGKGSNNVVSQVVPRRAFNARTGQVETKGQPPLTGSGFQSILTPPDVSPVVGLYAPKGEIRALDAFIVGKVEIAAPVVKGADNIAGQPPSGGGAPAPSVNLAPKIGNTQAGLEQVAEAGNERKQASEDGKLSVELLGLGAEGEAAASASASGSPERRREDEESEGKDKASKPRAR